MEKWKNLPYQYFNHFEISDTGRLKNGRTAHIYTLRVQKQTGLVFCDISVVDEEGTQYRKTIYITHEVAEAFVTKPKDAHLKEYKPTHKDGISKLNNHSKNLCWKTQSEFSKENMVKNPQNRNLLAAHQKKVFGVGEAVFEKEGCYYKGERKLSNFIIKEVPFRQGKILTRPNSFLMIIENIQGHSKTIFFNKNLTKYHLERAFISVGNFIFKGIKDDDWVQIIDNKLKNAPQYFQY